MCKYLPVSCKRAAVAKAFIAERELAYMWSFARMGAHMHCQGRALFVTYELFCL